MNQNNDFNRMEKTYSTVFDLLSIWVTGSNEMQCCQFGIYSTSIHPSIDHNFFDEVNCICCIGFIEEQDSININFLIEESSFLSFYYSPFNFCISSSTMYLHTGKTNIFIKIMKQFSITI